MRCLITKDNLDQCGTPEDIDFRREHPRIDDAERREGVRLAKVQITKGFAVKGKPVLSFLKFGAVPTTVSLRLSLIFVVTDKPC